MSPTLAQQLWQARRSGELLELAGLDLPSNEEQAYNLSRSITSLADATPIGYKIGATTDAAVTALGLTGPFHGPLFDQYSRASGEAEITVGLANALSDPARLRGCQLVLAPGADAQGGALPAEELPDVPTAWSSAGVRAARPLPAGPESDEGLTAARALLDELI